MTTISVEDLDRIRHIEVCIKKHINLTIPKFIIRSIAILIIKSNGLEDTYNEIYNYLIKVSKEHIINNKKLLTYIKKTFLSIELIIDLRQDLHQIDYKKLALEKNALLWEVWNDQHELSCDNKKWLANILKKWISIKININALKDKYRIYNSKWMPLVLNHSNDRILQINNFANSKVSHLVHDLFDHMYCFSELKKWSFFSFSSIFRQKVWNPEERDIFSRESELVASIAYERRYYLQNINNFKLSLKNDFIICIIKNYFWEDSYKYINKTNYLSKKRISVYHICYNVICELYEQIRKVWPIKLINNKWKFESDITTILINDYLKIIIDVLYFITKKEYIFKDMLLSIYSYVEYLINTCLSSNLLEYKVIVNLKTFKKHSMLNTTSNSKLRSFLNL